MTVLERVQRNKQSATGLIELWNLLISDPMPSPQQFAIWLSRHAEDTIAEAIECTAQKFATNKSRGRTMTLDDVIRYCSATQNNIVAERKNGEV